MVFNFLAIIYQKMKTFPKKHRSFVI